MELTFWLKHYPSSITMIYKTSIKCVLQYLHL